jgi:5,10-methylenetetrahydrofolate reductase
MSLQSKLTSGNFAVTCEVGPPKGTDITAVEEAAALLKGKVDAANVTDQQSAVMRLGALAVSSILLQRGLEPVFQITCRDRNRIALQSDLLSAWVLGIRNVLVCTGDHPSLGDHPQAKAVYDLDSVNLLQVIGGLNGGKDMAGNDLQGGTGFFPGAVVKVAADTETSLELQIIKMEKKVAAGAKFFQTQAVYDAGRFEQFMKRVAHLKVPVMAGIVPLKSAGMAKYMNENVAGVFVPDDIIKRMADAPKEDREKTGIRIAADLIKQLRPLCQGVHIMAIGWEKRVPSIMEAAGL